MFRVTLRVDEGERYAPRAPDHDPPVDAEVRAQALHVSDQVASGIGRQVCVGVAGQGAAAPAPSLVEDDRPVAGGIEVPPAMGEAGAPGPPCNQIADRPSGEPATSPVHGVTVAHVEMAGVVRLNGRVHGCDWG